MGCRIAFLKNERKFETHKTPAKLSDLLPETGHNTQIASVGLQQFHQSKIVNLQKGATKAKRQIL